MAEVLVLDRRHVELLTGVGIERLDVLEVRRRAADDRVDGVERVVLVRTSCSCWLNRLNTLKKPSSFVFLFSRWPYERWMSNCVVIGERPPRHAAGGTTHPCRRPACGEAPSALCGMPDCARKLAPVVSDARLLQVEQVEPVDLEVVRTIETERSRSGSPCRSGRSYSDVMFGSGWPVSVEKRPG